MFQKNLYRKSKHTFYVQCPFSKAVPFMRCCEKNIIEADRRQLKIWLMRIAFWIPKTTDIHS